MPPAAPSSVESGAIPRVLLLVLLTVLVVLITSGLALAVLHVRPTVPFFVLVRLHIVLGILFVPLGVWYLAAHTRRIGASRAFVPWLLVWMVAFFGLFFLQVPFLAATIIGVALGGALAAWLWWRSQRAYAWQSFATAIAVMLVIGGLIETGYVMAMPWTSMRTSLYHWTHLVLTPLLPAALWLHARARRRRPSVGSPYRLPRGWYAATAGLLLATTFWVAQQSAVISETIPEGSAYEGESSATMQTVKEHVSLDGGLDPAALQPSQSCGQSGCHLGLYRQWHGSAHRFASQNTAYLRAAEAFVARRGREAEVFCATCHNPLAVATGAYARRDWEAVQHYANEGVNCEGCHLQTPPPPELGRFSSRLRSFPDTPFPWIPNRRDVDDLRSQYLLFDAYFHRRKYFDPYMHRAEMCGACHGERHLDPDGKEIVLFDQYADWAKGPLKAAGVTCQKCHNNLDAYPHLEEDPMHARPNHMFPGIALDLPEAVAPGFASDEPHLQQDLRETAAFLRLFLDGEHTVSDYERRYLHLIGDRRIHAFEDYVEHRKVLDMSAQAQRAEDGSVTLTITSTNNKVGHDFPSGPPDLSEYWLAVAAKRPGQDWVWVIAHDQSSGAIDARAPRLGGEVYDIEGERLREHAIDRAGRVETWRIPFGASATHEVTLGPQEAPPGTLLRAEWYYRRYRPEFSQWAWRDPNRIFPAHRLASVQAEAP
jgi:hypothetical protein